MKFQFSSLLLFIFIKTINIFSNSSLFPIRNIKSGGVAWTVINVTVCAHPREYEEKKAGNKNSLTNNKMVNTFCRLHNFWLPLNHLVDGKKSFFIIQVLWIFITSLQNILVYGTVGTMAARKVFRVFLMFFVFFRHWYTRFNDYHY